MALRLVIPPAIEPLTLDEAKSQLRVTHSAEDALIEAYVSAARAACENYQRRSYITQTWELTQSSFPRCSAEEIILYRPEIQSVESVNYFDRDGAEITLDPERVFIDQSHSPPRLRLASGAWPAARTLNPGVRIRYIAGYGDGAVDVPDSVKQAMRFYIGHYDMNRAGVVTGTIATEIPETAKALLGPDRVFPV